MLATLSIILSALAIAFVVRKALKINNGYRTEMYTAKEFIDGYVGYHYGVRVKDECISDEFVESLIEYKVPFMLFTLHSVYIVEKYGKNKFYVKIYSNTIDHIKYYDVKRKELTYTKKQIDDYKIVKLMSNI